MQSKRSREASPDEGSSASRQKRQREGRAHRADASTKVYKRRGGKSLPAEDGQFLTADVNSARPKTKQRAKERGRQLQGCTADESESIMDLGVERLELHDDDAQGSVKSQKGKSRAR